MSLTIGVLKESAIEETRVALTPEIAKKLIQYECHYYYGRRRGRTLKSP